MPKHSLVIVSNRLPILVKKTNGQLVYSPSSGGLATAMQSIVGDRLWIGWPGIVSEELTTKERNHISTTLRKRGYIPVFLSRAQVESFYAGYSNDTIWPLFHYFQSHAQYDTAYWEGYQQVNKAYARVVKRYADQQSNIWVHDYHLMLLPQLIRSIMPDATIGFFLHIPFPSFEIFRALPNRADILRGLLGADLIGFHVYDYARHFLSSVHRVLGIENKHGSVVFGERIIQVDAFPIGIDYQKWADAAKDEHSQALTSIIDTHYSGKKIIMSVDRLDYSKGIKKRLEAFDAFLAANTKYHKKVVLVVVAVPSRMEVETYKLLRDEIERIVGRINGTYGTVDWMPISYQFKNLEFEQVAALFQRADIALLTPLRDGMNLVAKEFVASKQSKPGVLILSEMTGAVDELPEAIVINPNDKEAIVKALKQALNMPMREQRERVLSMQRRLQRYTVQRWSSDFLEQLQRPKFAQARRGSKLLDQAIKQRILRMAVRAKRRVILLDYDGTLRQFVGDHDPSAARPSKMLLQLLQELSELKNTLTCIISGRPRQALESWFADLPITLVAEHGAWMRYDGEWSQQAVSLHDYRTKIGPILEQYLERTPGAQVEHKDFSIVWHYRNVNTELANARNASLEYELNLLLANSEIGVYRGNKIIEIKPRNVHKSMIADELLALHRPDFVLCIGDDYTDESMFRRLPEEAFSIKVGLGETNARFQVVSVSDVVKLLRQVVDSIQRPAQKNPKG